jgi:hypothetical protein
MIDEKAKKLLSELRATRKRLEVRPSKDALQEVVALTVKNLVFVRDYKTYLKTGHGSFEEYVESCELHPRIKNEVLDRLRKIN